MSKSSEVINPKFPRDIDNLLREGNATVKMTRGALVVRSGERSIVLCDPANTAAHKYSPVELQWIDGENRDDVPVVQPDGTMEYQHTCLGDSIVADVIADDTLFDGDAPQEGDVVIKSIALTGDSGVTINPGKMRALSPAEVTAAVTTNSDLSSEEFDAMKIGTVEGGSERPGMVRVKFQLG